MNNEGEKRAGKNKGKGSNHDNNKKTKASRPKHVALEKKGRRLAHTGDAEIQGILTLRLMRRWWERHRTVTQGGIDERNRVDRWWWWRLGFRWNDKVPGACIVVGPCNGG